MKINHNINKPLKIFMHLIFVIVQSQQNFINDEKFPDLRYFNFHYWNISWVIQKNE